MKKNLLLLTIVIGFGFASNAQDIIILKNGDEIKSLVQEIGTDYVLYKKWENQGGPSYYLIKSEVFIIQYQNGTRDVFNEVAKTSPSNEVAKTSPSIPQANQESKLYSNDLKNEFYRIDADDRQMLNFFRKNNFMNYYNDFEYACRMRETGRGLLIGGLILTGFGIVFISAGLVAISNGYYGTYWMPLTGYAFIGVGEILTIVSIPISAVGGGKKRAIKNDFAREHFGIYSYTSQPTLNLGYTGNGIGISLKF
jgi:hypothetical protein